MSPQIRSHTSVFRLGLYFLLQGALLAGYVAVVVKTGQGRMGELDLEGLLRENQLLEWVQLGLLFCIGAMCLGAFRAGEPVLHRILALFAIFAGFREMDSLLEDVLFDGAHTMLMSCVAIGIAVLAWTSRHELTDQIPEFFSRPGFFIMLFGAAFVVLYAQILGQRDIYRLFVEKDLQSEAKRFIEEGLEFLGYIIIGCGVFEERFFGAQGRGGRNSPRIGL